MRAQLTLCQDARYQGPLLTRLCHVQGVHNLCAADAACLNRQVIVWLSETVAEAAAAAAATEEGAPSGGEEAAEEAEAAGEGRGQRLLLLQHQLLSLLRLSGSYSISGGFCTLLYRYALLYSAVLLYSNSNAWAGISGVWARLPESGQQYKAVPVAGYVVKLSGDATTPPRWRSGKLQTPCHVCHRRRNVRTSPVPAARDLRSLLQLLRPDADGRPPPHAGAVLEVWSAPLVACLASTPSVPHLPAAGASNASLKHLRLFPWFSRIPLKAMEAMASHRTGPACFFNFGSGSGAAMPGQAGGAQQQQPSGIVCSASLGGGGGASTGGSSGASAAGSSSSSFLRLPKQGYSFAAWVRLEDGRAAIDQLLSTPHAAAGASAAATSDQALFALLHQQKPPSGAHQAHHFPFGHGHAPQLLQGVALAVRQVDSPMLPAGSVSPGGQRPPLQLVAHSWSPKHAEAALPLQQPLLPGRWHHVALTHSAGGPLTPAEVCLYLDGQLQVCGGVGACRATICLHSWCARGCPERPVCRACIGLSMPAPLRGLSVRSACCDLRLSPQATARLRYPAIKEPLSSVCMGAGALLRPLRGQAGAALLFEDLLAPGEIATTGRDAHHNCLEPYCVEWSVLLGGLPGLNPPARPPALRS